MRRAGIRLRLIDIIDCSYHHDWHHVINYRKLPKKENSFSSQIFIASRSNNELIEC